MKSSPQKLLTCRLKPKVTSFSGIKPKVTNFSGIKTKVTGCSGIKPKVTSFSGMKAKVTGCSGIWFQDTLLPFGKVVFVTQLQSPPLVWSRGWLRFFAMKPSIFGISAVARRKITVKTHVFCFSQRRIADIRNHVFSLFSFSTPIIELCMRWECRMPQ